MNFDKLIQFRKQSRYRTVHHFKKFLMHSCNQPFLSSLTSANTNFFSIQFCPYKKVIWRESYSTAMFRVHLLSINTIHLKLILVIVYTSSTVLIGWLTDRSIEGIGLVMKRMKKHQRHWHWQKLHIEETPGDISQHWKCKG